MLSVLKYEPYSVCHVCGICLNRFWIPLSLFGRHTGAGPSPNCSPRHHPCVCLCTFNFFCLDTKEESSSLSRASKITGSLSHYFKTSCFISTIWIPFPPTVWYRIYCMLVCKIHWTISACVFLLAQSTPWKFSWITNFPLQLVRSVWVFFFLSPQNHKTNKQLWQKTQTAFICRSILWSCVCIMVHMRGFCIQYLFEGVTGIGTHSDRVLK